MSSSIFGRSTVWTIALTRSARLHDSDAGGDLEVLAARAPLRAEAPLRDAVVVLRGGQLTSAR